MVELLHQDVQALNKWLGQAWSLLADRNLTPFERREVRNYMKEAEIALSAGLKRIADRDRMRREAERNGLGHRRPEFRILQLDT